MNLTHLFRSKSFSVCIMCYVMKSSVKPVWVVLRCDHLICINCVLNKQEELKRIKECGCGEKFEEGIYHYIKTENCGYGLAMERISMKRNSETTNGKRLLAAKK